MSESINMYNNIRLDMGDDFFMELQNNTEYRNLLNERSDKEIRFEALLNADEKNLYGELVELGELISEVREDYTYKKGLHVDIERCKFSEEMWTV